MVITNNKVVSVSYELRTKKEGEIIEKTSIDNPLTFLFGHGNMLPKFESHLDGLKTGDSFDFQLICDDAYGKSSKEAIVEIPVSAFEIDGKTDDTMLFMGNIIPMMDNHGNRFNGKVINVTDTTVTMDFNHPMADEDLFFSGSIIDIREATDEEITHGHIHKSCGCGSGGCGDGHGEGSCCSSEEENCEENGHGGCGCRH